MTLAIILMSGTLTLIMKGEGSLTSLTCFTSWESAAPLHGAFLLLSTLQGHLCVILPPSEITVGECSLILYQVTFFAVDDQFQTLANASGHR